MKEQNENAADAIDWDPEWSSIPPHRYHVYMCHGPRCARRGANRLCKLLAQQLREAGLLELEGGVLLTRTHCQFPCNLGPVLTVYPEGTWYRIGSEEDIVRLVREHFLQGVPVDNLRLNVELNDDKN
ncbi:(2Fe-2S) ferredoxin domain-containing protein [Salmonella enterica subsp. enterica]|nr:(2Fe-2S) ferredoxin domain-containing protein [Salmonella enterica]EBY0806537.1 (2Fe-2S) ferredoxin domain-containing protein [Salmonella enterica subsp. enterica serovar Berlin]ECF3780517.1 (2Fe-2S) ferredoxin domain-containing protein [Salmonella enterica subsp. enterica serovar Oslo]EDR2104874.1 (2Fe-2S) ferredoxin domain-containing protein [Salmonella enterica subsp. enterica]EDW0613090.1 (2Fe-2S) ferredoxin domain-containing protein [Salmonella enterica subsp. enterica serovar Ball]EGZ